MINTVDIPKKEIERVILKYDRNLDDNPQGDRALSYFIHTKFCEVNGFNFRQRIEHLKTIKHKLDKWNND
jgi:hypothetical protein